MYDAFIYRSPFDWFIRFNTDYCYYCKYPQ